MKPEISVLLPMFNEADVLDKTLAVVSEELKRSTERFELICVDDGSTDQTWELLVQAQTTDARVRPLQLSRNFGKEAAMAAGLDIAEGEAVLLLDADLQHPADLIVDMIAAWKAGADVVNGVKVSRGKEGIIYKSMAACFNLLMGGRAGGWQGASDFKLLDRQVVEALRLCPERHRFFRGLVAWVGFSTVDIPFHVQERAGGETKWSTGALVRYSLRNLLSFSALPLRLIAAGGFSTLLFALAMAGWTLFRYVRGDSLAGFPTVILLQLLFGGILLTSLGVMSLYLAEMFDEVKRRPVYLYRVGRPSKAQESPAEESRSSRP